MQCRHSHQTQEKGNARLGWEWAGRQAAGGSRQGRWLEGSRQWKGGAATGCHAHEQSERERTKKGQARGKKRGKEGARRRGKKDRQRGQEGQAKSTNKARKKEKSKERTNHTWAMLTNRNTNRE